MNPIILSRLEDYEKNLLIKRAVERELEIMSKAMNRILYIEPDININYLRRIVDLTNRVIHGYDKVDDSIIWGILIKYLPSLKERVKDLIQND